MQCQVPMSTPAAATRTSTSSSPSVGFAVSATRSTASDSVPYASWTIAFIASALYARSLTVAVGSSCAHDERARGAHLQACRQDERSCGHVPLGILAEGACTLEGAEVPPASAPGQSRRCAFRIDEH